jgi:ribonuclease R
LSNEQKNKTSSRGPAARSATTRSATRSTEREPRGDYIFPIPSREDILAELRSDTGTLTPNQLAERLGVTEREQAAFEKRLGAMERDGQLMPNRKGVLLLAKKLDFIAGRVSGHRDGYGFLIRDDGGPDLYLSPKEMLKVLHGDRVLVKQTGVDSRGKPEGTIVEVIERRTNRLVGRFLNERGVHIVVPEDQRIKHDILIPPTETIRAQHGQVVMVEIIEQPSRYSQPLGRVVEVLGEIDDPGMEIEIAVRKFDVPHQFSPEAEEQAAKLPSEVRKRDAEGRVDIRDVPLVTIDGEDARDFDDAVYCEPVEIGTGKRTRPGWRLIVAIADVSHYVTDGDALDHDARERSTSVYFPRRVIPMLPEKLSNGLCSLNPQVDRLVMVCDMVIAASGAKAGGIEAYQFYPAVMHSAARLTYTDVWSALSQPDGPVARKIAHLTGHLAHLYELYQLLSQTRVKRGAIDFDTVETYIVCNSVGKIEQILPRVRNDAHKLIEEAMLAANTCAADFLERSKHPTLYRVHEGPTPERLLNLRAFLKTVGLELGGGNEPQASDYAALMEKVKGRADAPLLQSLVLRSMQQAVYSPDNLGHFGLAYEAYAHFTSPIRRYPDLLTHRAIKAALQGSRYAPSPLDENVIMADTPKEREHAIWEKLGMVCSANERRADDASRDVEAWLKCYFMKERVGETYSGTVTGVAPFGIFVTLDDLFVEGLVHVSELGTEYLKYNDALHELRGERTGQRYRLTDRVHVQVSRVDLEARRIEFRLERAVTYADVMRGALAEKRTGRAAKKTAASKPRDIDKRDKARDPAAPKRVTASRKQRVAEIQRTKKGKR